jgi:peptidoglycan hydrolase CwlO-like protein
VNKSSVVIIVLAFCLTGLAAVSAFLYLSLSRELDTTDQKLEHKDKIIGELSSQVKVLQETIDNQGSALEDRTAQLQKQQATLDQQLALIKAKDQEIALWKKNVEIINTCFDGIAAVLEGGDIDQGEVEATCDKAQAIIKNL